VEPAAGIGLHHVEPQAQARTVGQRCKAAHLPGDFHCQRHGRRRCGETGGTQVLAQILAAKRRLDPLVDVVNFPQVHVIEPGERQRARPLPQRELHGWLVNARQHGLAGSGGNGRMRRQDFIGAGLASLFALID
jgi:hypothetical protein